MNTMASNVKDYDQRGTSLVNGSVVDTIYDVFKSLGTTVGVIERWDHKDDEDDEGQPYECWCADQVFVDNTDYMMLRVYPDQSWVTVWG